MAYHLVNEEAIQDGVRRIAGELVDDALERVAKLRQSEADRDEQIHELRKRTKELRGLLRFVRTHLKEGGYRAENRLLSELARGYGGAREAGASLESLGKLEKRFPESAGLLEGLRAPLQARARLDVSSEVTLERLDENARALEAFRARSGRWRFSSEGFAAIEPNLRRTYRQGRRAFTAARKLVTHETHHAWRKRVKDHLYHVELLLNLWPALMRARRSELKRLGNVLGDEHDSSRFLAVLHRLPLEERARLDWEFIYSLVEQQTRELRREAWELGALLYAESPKRLTGRFERYYRAVHEPHEKLRFSIAKPALERSGKNRALDIGAERSPTGEATAHEGSTPQEAAQPELERREASHPETDHRETSHHDGPNPVGASNGKRLAPGERSLAEPPSR